LSKGMCMHGEQIMSGRCFNPVHLISRQVRRQPSSQFFKRALQSVEATAHQFTCISTLKMRAKFVI